MLRATTQILVGLLTRQFTVPFAPNLSKGQARGNEAVRPFGKFRTHRERSQTRFIAGLIVAMFAWACARADEVTLLETPKVTATLIALDEGGYAAQIGVHTGPIAQLVNTVVRANSTATAERLLRKQIVWRAPYLFVHSSCGGGRSLRCEGETVFKVVENTAIRLGDLIGADAQSVYRGGHFYDVYDKLDRALGIAPEFTPRFVLVLNDVGGKLDVDAAATWSANAVAWREHIDYIAATQPRSDWPESEWLPYFSALTSNTALARYCNKQTELQSMLDMSTPSLSPDQSHLVTDALFNVVPLESPKAWRASY